MKKDYRIDKTIKLNMPRVIPSDSRIICTGFVDTNRIHTTSCQLEQIDFNEALENDRILRKCEKIK